MRSNVSSSSGMAGMYECEVPPVVLLPAAPVARARLGVFSTAEKREVPEAVAVLDAAAAPDPVVAARRACWNHQRTNTDMINRVHTEVRAPAGRPSTYSSASSSPRSRAMSACVNSSSSVRLEPSAVERWTTCPGRMLSISSINVLCQRIGLPKVCDSVPYQHQRSLWHE